MTNYADLKAAGDAGDMIVKNITMQVSSHKPKKEDFFRVHPSDEFKFSPVFLLERKDENCFYIVSNAMIDELKGHCCFGMILTAITFTGEPFLWPVKVRYLNGRTNRWYRTACDAARKAEFSWIRLEPNMAKNHYEIFQAQGVHQDPEWPKQDFEALFDIAFFGKIIDSPDHLIAQKLKGLVK